MDRLTASAISSLRIPAERRLQSIAFHYLPRRRQRLLLAAFAELAARAVGDFPICAEAIKVARLSVSGGAAHLDLLHVGNMVDLCIMNGDDPEDRNGWRQVHNGRFIRAALRVCRAAVEDQEPLEEALVYAFQGAAGCLAWSLTCAGDAYARAEEQLLAVAVRYATEAAFDPTMAEVDADVGPLTGDGAEDQRITVGRKAPLDWASRP